MKPRLRPILSFLLLGLIAQRLWAAAVFSQPFVDVFPNAAGSVANFAVWSTTDSTVAANTYVTLNFPPDVNFPATLNLGGCQCVFFKFTSTSAGAFTPGEITVTAGVVDASLKTLAVQVPQDMLKGKFYLRVGSTAGFSLPLTIGAATLVLVDPSGNSNMSQAYYISATYTAALGSVNGRAFLNGVSQPAAMVFATSYGSYHSNPAGPRTYTAQAMSTTMSAYTIATGFDGSYSLSLPYGVYSIKSEAYRVTRNPTTKVFSYQNVTSTVSTITINATPVTTNFTLPAFP